MVGRVIRSPLRGSCPAMNELEVVGVQPRAQVSVIPFAATTYDQAYEEADVKVGVDFSWKPSPKLEIAATANPDFGAVEADDIVLNLTASETFFPEKRLFFLRAMRCSASCLR